MKVNKKNIIHEGPKIDSVERFDVIECSACGFKHVSPLPSKEEINALYEKSFYSKEKSNYFKSVEDDLKWWMETYRSYFHLFEKHTNGKKLLDIGSGPGIFLKCGTEMGWNSHGIEPSPLAYEYSSNNGANVLNGFFPDNRVNAKGPFDVVYMNMVRKKLPLPYLNNFIRLFIIMILTCYS